MVEGAGARNGVNKEGLALWGGQLADKNGFLLSLLCI